MQSRCSFGINCLLLSSSLGLAIPSEGLKGLGLSWKRFSKSSLHFHISSRVETLRFLLPSVTRSSVPPHHLRGLPGWVASVSRAGCAATFLTRFLTPPLSLPSPPLPGNSPFCIQSVLLFISLNLLG